MRGWRIEGVVRFNKCVESVLLRCHIKQVKDKLETDIRKRYISELEKEEEHEHQLFDSNISNGIDDDDEAAVDAYDLASETPELNDDDVLLTYRSLV